MAKTKIPFLDGAAYRRQLAAIRATPAGRRAAELAKCYKKTGEAAGYVRTFLWKATSSDGGAEYEEELTEISSTLSRAAERLKALLS